MRLLWQAVLVVAVLTSATVVALVESQSMTTPPVPVLEFIWFIEGIEPAPGIIMMLEQEDHNLLGAAKYEAEGGQPWNAVVVGSVNGDKVDLATTALKESELVSSMLTGTLTEDPSDGKSIAGKFFRVSEGHIFGLGEFTATIAFDDISAYEPAKIDNHLPETPAQPVQLRKSRFTPVESLKDKYMGPADMLSGVPIGMEGTYGSPPAPEGVGPPAEHTPFEKCQSECAMNYPGPPGPGSPPYERCVSECYMNYPCPS